MRDPASPRNPRNPIPLDPSFLRFHGQERTEETLRGIVRSVRFELLARDSAVRLLGPDMYYHGLDPFLPEVLAQLGCGPTSDDVLAYKATRAHFDLCLEDSWSGFFIADILAAQNVGEDAGEDFVLVHLDDHTDMMPTLLARSSDTLTDLVCGRTFDPASRSAWEAGIYSGSINIGSFITPLFYSGRAVHVRHLNNDATSKYESSDVIRESCRYEPFPGIEFAGIRRRPGSSAPRAGTYLYGSDSSQVLRALPPGRVVVHIDLDYFINDFNGNTRSGPIRPIPS